MRCFKIPLTRLDLFLIALRMNATKVYEVDFIFQFQSHYDVVVLDLMTPYDQDLVEKFAGKLWSSALSADAPVVPKLPFDPKKKKAPYGA